MTSGEKAPGRQGKENDESACEKAVSVRLQRVICLPP